MNGNIILPLPFEALIKSYEREVMRLALRITGNREDALDLFQETWLRAYRAYPRVDHSGNMRAWIHTIAINVSLNYKRNAARRSRVMTDQTAGVEAASNHANPDQVADVTRLRTLITALPRKQREALLLRKVSGLDYPDIGVVLECSATSARANVSHALKKIRSKW